MNISDIGTGDLALLCVTDLQECCGSLGHGEWYFSNNNMIVSTKESNTDFYRDRGDSVVRLNRRNNVTMPIGEYCCEVPDANYTNQTVCISVTLFEMPAGLGERIKTSMQVAS